MTFQRAGLYTLLAELLAEPPEWMNLPGREWPLFDLLTQLAKESTAASHHMALVAGLPSEEVNQRRKRYASIFASGRPNFWLYESAANTGKILGPETFEMASLYRAAGLEAVGAELPDHISLELAFLAYLAGQIDDLSFEQQFLEKHGVWMIDLGRALQKSGDTVYAEVGALLTDWITEAQRPTVQTSATHCLPSNVNDLLPAIPSPDDCTLCGFCSQVCPTHALKVMQNTEDNFLSLNVAECIHCSKCERICNSHAIVMSLPSLIGREAKGESHILRQSPHALCQTCGKPIASQAEMDYIVSQIGDAFWQRLCLDCRPGLYA